MSLLVCDDCGLQFTPKVSHFASRTSSLQGNILCSDCGKSFVAKTRLKAHQQQAHSSENSCNLGNQVFTHHSKLSNHIRIVHQEEKIECKMTLHLKIQFNDYLEINLGSGYSETPLTGGWAGGKMVIYRPQVGLIAILLQTPINYYLIII